MSLSRNCRKFQSLYARKLAGKLTPKEQLFLLQHPRECPRCQKLEQEILQVRRLIKEQEILYEPSEDLSRRVLRALRQERLLRQLQVWKPTLIGAGITAMAIASVLQVLTSEINLNPPPEGTAHRQTSPALPGENRLFIPETTTKEQQSPFEG